MKNIALKISEAKETVQTLTIKEKFCEVVNQAIKSYKELDAQAKSVHSRRTKASNINDYINHYIVKEIQGLPGIRLLPKYGQIRILYEDKVLLIYKRVNRNNVPADSRTKRWNDFKKQRPDLTEFPNMPDTITTGIIGHRWDGIHNPIVGIVFPPDFRPEDKIDLFVQELPTASVDIPTSKPNRVIPRKARAKSKER